MKQYDSQKRAKARYKSKNKEKIRVRAREIAALKRAGVYVPVDRKLSPEQKDASQKRRREVIANWWKENKDKVAEIAKRYCERHPGRRADSVRRSRLKHLEERGPIERANSAQWRKDNPKETDRRWREWRKTHPRDLMVRRERAKQYGAAHPEKARARSYRRRLRKLQIAGSHSAEEWKALCDGFDNRCVRCGAHSKLTRDHVVPITKEGSTDFIENIQPLCRTCNSTKHNSAALDYRGSPFKKQGQIVLFL